VVFWSLMTMLTAHAWGKSERGLVNGVTHSCGNFATPVAPIVSVALIAAFGWRSIFHIFGVFGIVWSVGWWFVYRDRPEEHKRVNSAKATYIRDGVSVVTAKKVQIPWKLILGRLGLRHQRRLDKWKLVANESL
jgi:nitrate/nitrite transporter NarK